MLRCQLLLAPANGEDVFAGADDDAEKVVAGVMGYVRSRALNPQLDADAAPPWQGAIDLWFGSERQALACAHHAHRIVAALAPAARLFGTFTGHERIVLQTPGWFDGGAIKLSFLFRRRADLEIRQFQQHWWHRHGPIAARTEGALRYVQVHAVPGSYTAAAELTQPPWDGITELYWPDVPQAAAAMASRQMREDQASDARNFVATDSISAVLAQEQVVVAP